MTFPACGFMWCLDFASVFIMTLSFPSGTCWWALTLSPGLLPKPPVASPPPSLLPAPHCPSSRTSCDTASMLRPCPGPHTSTFFRGNPAFLVAVLPSPAAWGVPGHPLSFRLGAFSAGSPVSACLPGNVSSSCETRVTAALRCAHWFTSASWNRPQPRVARLRSRGAWLVVGVLKERRRYTA